MPCQFVETLPVLFHNILDPSSLQQLLCALAPVCTTWQAAVEDLYKHCPQCLDVSLEADEHAPAVWSGTIRSFSMWLLHHAGLVRSISISKGTCGDADEICRDMSAQQTLAAAMSASSSTTTTSAGAGQHLQLQAYSSDCMGSACILQALPATHITSLQLLLPQHSRTDPTLPSCSQLASAFERLGHLQCLTLSFRVQQSVSDSLFEGLVRLTSLADLTLGLLLGSGTVVMLQGVLAQLPLLCLQLRCTYVSDSGLILQHLTQLTDLELRLSEASWLTAGHVTLPTQLKALNIKAHVFDPFTTRPVFGIRRHPESPLRFETGTFPPLLGNLTDLRQLQVFKSSTLHQLPHALIQHMAQLSSLQEVSLSYDSLQAAAGNHSDWVQLRHLRRLGVSWADSETYPEPIFSRATLSDVLRSVGAVKTLTSLRVSSVAGGLRQYMCLRAHSAWLGVLLHSAHAGLPVVLLRTAYTPC